MTELRPPFCEEFPAAPVLASRSITPAVTGPPIPMNRLDLVIPPFDQSSTADSFELSWPSGGDSPSVATATQTVTVELITRRVKPGCSVRRLRHHRCAWPRRF